MILAEKTGEPTFFMTLDIQDSLAMVITISLVG